MEAARTLRPQGDVTRLLVELSAGNEKAGEELLSAVYAELHALAHQHMRSERSGHTLQTTALIHEAWLRLVGQDKSWNNRTHFLRVAAQAMRRVLVEYARRKRCDKREGGRLRLSLEEATPTVDAASPDLLDLDEALEAMSRVDERAGQVFELRFFGGLTAEETARVVGVTSRTVLRDWKIARTWLATEIER